MFEFVQKCFSYVDLFFVCYLIGYATFLLFSVTIGSISLYEHKKRQMLYNTIENEYYVPVSIIIPAHNESTTIIDTVESLLVLDYKLYEIIVVDDGSTDDTVQKMMSHFTLKRINRPIRKKLPTAPEKEIYIGFGQKVHITLVCKENGGKADALNMGINTAEYPYFICMDADSMLQEDALKNIIRPTVQEKNVIACGGSVRIMNDFFSQERESDQYQLPKNLIVCMQMIEYDRAFLASRLLFDQFNGNLIISGAFGLFKKDMVIAVGGYDKNNIGEDMELVVRLHAFCRVNKISYKIKYVPDAICWSQAPHTLTDLRKQRRRWHIGLFQSITAHKQIFFNSTYGGLSFISFVYFIIYELLSPYIEFFGIITIIVAKLFNIINVPYMILFLGIYILFGSMMSLTAFISRVYAMNMKLRVVDVLKGALLCIGESVFLRTILAYTRMAALMHYRRDRLRWGSIKRKGIQKGT